MQLASEARANGADQPGRRRPAWLGVIAAVSPLGVLLALLAGTLASLAQSWLVGACLVIGACLALSVVSGLWVVRVSGMPSEVRTAMWATAGVACLLWALQRLAYVLLVPNGFLTYGYFLTQPGSTTRVYVMSAPLEVGAIGFAMAFVVAARSAIRTGVGWWAITLLLWWLVTYAVFALPSVNLWAQGDAAIFI